MSLDKIILSGISKDSFVYSGVNIYTRLYTYTYTPYTYTSYTYTSLRIFYRPTILMKSLCRHNTVAIFGRKTASYFFRKKYLSLTLTGFCVPKRVGYGHPFSSLRASQEFVLFGRGCLCHDIPNATVDFSCTSTRVCWAYHQLCWLWNLVFRPSAKSNRHQCLLCASE